MLPDQIESSLPQLLNEAQRALIENKTPECYVKQRKGRGGLTLDYVEIGYVIRQLNLLFGHLWDFEIITENILQDEVIVRGRLTVKSVSGQKITKEQYGTNSIQKYKETGNPISIGDDMKAAGSDCLKKCASLIGVALDVYSKEGNVTDSYPSNSPLKTEKTHDGNGNGNGAGNKASNPMTTFWSNVYNHGFSREVGQKTLQDAGGDPEKALAIFVNEVLHKEPF